MAHELTTEITIDASPSTVWDVLVELDRYADWTPFVVEASGDPRVGERLTNRIEPPGGQSVVLPIGNPPTSVETAQLSLLYDRDSGDTWDLSLSAETLRHPAVTLLRWRSRARCRPAGQWPAPA